MKLKRVIYELFEADLISLFAHPDWHEIDREICLEFECGQRRYFSWCNKPEQYSIGNLGHRFNENEPDHIINASEWPIWSGLIGCEIKFRYRESCQILEITGSDTSVYLSSQEGGSWYVDVLHISRILPEFNS